MALFADASAGFEEWGDRRSLAWADSRMGVIAVGQRNVPTAVDALDRALTGFQALRDWWSAVQVVTQIAHLAMLVGRPADSLILLAAVDAFHAREGIAAVAGDDAGRLALLGAARSKLDADEASTMLERGHLQSNQETITLARSVVLACRGIAPVAEGVAAGVHARLTRREREVLDLLTLGLTDRQIAERLSVSPRTVGGHMANLLAKLGVESRTAAAVHAIQRDID